jgi:ribosomal protein S18 acetylase RimI-like enzyme
VDITPATEVTDELVDAIVRLIPQLSSTAPIPSRADLEEVVGSPSTTVLVARQSGAIVGTLALVVFRIPTGPRAQIEDVVVDEAARGRGVGEALTREAIRRARDAGARYVMLTSDPSRVTANRLYQRLGFELRGTNVYLLRFS